MQNAPQALKSRLYHLQTINDTDMWIQQCEGYPIFKKQDSIYKFKYYSLPHRAIEYEIIVDTNIHFQKNQNGIQWTQIKQNQVMAISFKEQYGANAFWQLIQQYQRKYAIAVPAAQGILFYFQYKVPDPTPNNLNQFLNELQAIPQQERHQRVVSIFLTKRDLVPKLLSVFKKLDQNQQIEKLQKMFDIIKLIFNSSNEELLYQLMCNDSYMSVLGALQYDPNFKNNRPKHRQFMKYQSKLLEVVPFNNKNQDLYHLIVFTYRLQYIKQCVLFPYLNDYSFTCTSYIIKNNYRKILSHVFNPRKKQFINNLFDLMRAQDVKSFKMLRQIFRIGKSVYANDIYQKIAQRDFFDILIKNMKQHKENVNINININTNINIDNSNIITSGSQSLKKKKKNPQQISQIVQICIQIIQQFMEFQPNHFRNYCVSQNEKVSKFPTFQFLLQQFDLATPIIGQKIGNILKNLISVDNHQIKNISHQKILNRFLQSQNFQHFSKWIPLFSKIIEPFDQRINEKIEDVLNLFINYLEKGQKKQQIQIITTLKTIIHVYVNQNQKIQRILMPKIKVFANYFLFNKGSIGIRVSTFLSILQPKKYSQFAIKIAQQIQKHVGQSKLMSKYLRLLKGFANRLQFQLPSSLKRQKSAQILLDEESFDKLQKKIKID